MNKYGRLAAALAAGFALSGSAMAALICNNPTPCVFTGPGSGTVYVGTYNPVNGDSSIGIAHDAMDNTIAGGVFQDAFFFDISPAGSAGFNAVFLPPSNITLFGSRLFAVTASTCGALGSSCNTVTYGALVASATTGPGFVSNLGFTGPLLGRYAIVVDGKVSGGPAGPGQAGKGYSINLTTVQSIPEPASVALVGLGLLAAGFAARRRNMV